MMHTARAMRARTAAQAAVAAAAAASDAAAASSAAAPALAHLSLRMRKSLLPAAATLLLQPSACACAASVRQFSQHASARAHSQSRPPQRGPAAGGVPSSAPPRNAASVRPSAVGSTRAQQHDEDEGFDKEDPDAEDDADDDLLEAARYTKSMHRLPGSDVRALKARPAHGLAPPPALDVPHALASILDLVERPSSAVAAAMSPLGALDLARPPKPVPVPASVQVGVMDDVIDSFDPALQRALKEGDRHALHELKQTHERSTVEQFLEGREVVVEKHRPGFSLGDSRFAPTERSGELNPDVLHSVALTGASESALAKGRKAAIQLSLNELLDVAGVAHARAVETSNQLHGSLASALAPRTMPNVSARSESAAALKTRQLKELEAVFEAIEARASPTVFHYTVMLNAYGREGFVADAERLFADMLASRGDKVPYKLAHFFPDTVACNSMLAMYDRTLRTFVRGRREEADKYTEAARGIIRTMSQQGIVKDQRTYTAMIHLLCNQLAFASPERSQQLLSESLQLFDYMQSMAAGSLKPSRRTYAILIQALSLSGDHAASMTLLQHMMSRAELFPNMALLNGLVKATAFGAAKDVPSVSNDDLQSAGGSKLKAPKVDLTPVQRVASMMKQLKLPPNEHTVVSAIKGFVRAGHINAALELHDHLDHGSLGTARPTKMTYTALLSALVSDHAIPMSTCLERYERALSNPNIFPSPLKRRGTVLDLRSLGHHPELYTLALTKQLHAMLRKYMDLQVESRAARAQKYPGPDELHSERALRDAERDEHAILDAVVPSRGWLILTGRHAGDMDLVVDAKGAVRPAGFERGADDIGLHELDSSIRAPDDAHLASLKDEFPDDGDYSAFDDSGILKHEQRRKRKDKRLHPLLPGYTKPKERVAHALNTATHVAPSGAFGTVAERFLRAQTPSMTATLTNQFAKESKDPFTLAREEAAEREAQEQEAMAKGKTPPAFNIPGATAAAASSITSSADPSSSPALDPRAPDATPDAPYGYDEHRRPLTKPRGWWIPYHLRPDNKPAKTEQRNEGMLIVRRPVLHFWLQCHAWVLRWHEEAQQARREIDERMRAEAEAQAAAEGVPAVFSPPPPAAAIRVPRPPFLPSSRSERWWSALAESIEVQHGLAVLRSSFDLEREDDRQREQEERYKAWRKRNAWRGSTRDGRIVGANGEEVFDAPDTEAHSHPPPPRRPGQSSSAPSWSVRDRKLVPKPQPRKRKPRLTVQQ